MVKAIINENQRGLLFRNGKFADFLMPGKYFYLGSAEIETLLVDEAIAPEHCTLETLIRNEKVAKNIHTIKDLINIKDEYDAIIVCYENEKTNSLKKELKSIKEMLKAKSEIKIAVVIGPEGGLEEKNVEELQQNGAKIVTLGNIILRTETVALNILSVIMYEFSEF